jgi:hypothetical protein
MSNASDTSIDEITKNLQPLKNDSHRPVDVAAFIRFVREMRLDKMFSSLSDERQLGKVQYKLSSLIFWAFFACSFRIESKNAFQTTLEGLLPEQRQGMLNLLQIEGDSLPHSSTVDNALARIPLEQLSQTFLNLLKQLGKRKFFYNHPELFPNNCLQVACDGFWMHKYAHPHSVNKDGSNACPYCLPRTHDKGTSKEKTYWVHVVATFVMVCDGFTLPLFVYPLKRGQVDLQEGCDDKFKEECELKAAYAILPIIRANFPKTPILFLGDALYANKPVIKLCKELKIDYAIVLKEKVLKLLNAHCDQLAQTELYQRYYTRKMQQPLKHKILHQQASWFNHEHVGDDVFTNVLKYEESSVSENGSSKAGYKGAWICSKKITAENCFLRAQTGRSRWNHEDLHNTAKNRGFDMAHDMARANPALFFCWKLINFIAYFLSELFRCTTIAQGACQSRSWKKIFRDMLSQLVCIAWEMIVRSPMLSKSKVQFRYQFHFRP